jgi:hypothetical protein
MVADEDCAKESNQIRVEKARGAQRESEDGYDTLTIPMEDFGECTLAAHTNLFKSSGVKSTPANATPPPPHQPTEAAGRKLHFNCGIGLVLKCSS